MDISNYAPKLAIIGYQHTSKWMLEKTSCSPVFAIYSFSISIKKFGKLV